MRRIKEETQLPNTGPGQVNIMVWIMGFKRHFVQKRKWNWLRALWVTEKML